MLVNFSNQYDVHERVNQNPGNPIKVLYQGRVDEDGRIVLDESGQVNLYDEIQSHRDSVDIHVLMQRYADGDVDVLGRVQGVYADITEMPKTYAELLNSVIAGEEMFNGLPVEVKERFNNSFTEFMATMDRPVEFFEKLGQTPPAASADDVKKEVKTDES